MRFSDVQVKPHFFQMLSIDTFIYYRTHRACSLHFDSQIISVPFNWLRRPFNNRLGSEDIRTEIQDGVS